MNWKTLKNRYPEIWETVEEGMLNDLLECMPTTDIDLFRKTKKGRIARIAHNAAFLACDSVRKNKGLIEIKR